MKKIKTLLILFCIHSAIIQAQCALTTQTQVPLGAGLDGLKDWSLARSFNDVFKTNRAIAGPTNAPWQGLAVTKDANGWATQDFGVIVMASMTSNMGGTYKLSFNGQATLTPIASGFTVANKVYNASQNLTTADLVYPATIPANSQMMISFTNTTYTTGIGGVKNIKILKPGLSSNPPTFDSTFLAHSKRFNMLRFMDWHSTNANSDSLWTNRTHTTDASFTSSKSGVAWEYCIELANTLNKDMWINVPIKADNNYIVQLATLIKNTLNPNLNVYVEHSNEVWNWGFSQTQWNLQQAIIEGNTPGSDINYDNVNDQWTWHQRRHAKRCKDISDVFKTVWGANAINNRVRVVWGAQFGYFSFSQRGIEFLNDKYGNPSNYLYGIGVAPYFNLNGGDTLTTLTSTQVMNLMQASVDKIYGQYGNMMDAFKARAEYYNLKLLAYEGGPDTFGPNNIAAKKAASQSPAMKNLCIEYLQKWYQYGLDNQFNWFIAGAGKWDTQYGTWSLTENYENSEKLQAIDYVLNTPPTTPTVGFAIPGNIDTRLEAGYVSTWNTQWNNMHTYPVRGWGLPYFTEYLLRVPTGQAGNYNLVIESGASTAGLSFEIWIDNVFIKTVNVPNNGANQNSTTLTDDSPVCVYLPNCFHTLRLKYTQTGIYIGKAKFTPSTCNTTGINTLLNSNKSIVVYPNPSNGKFVITSLHAQKATIYNHIGQSIATLQLNEQENQFDFSYLASGVYFIKTLDASYKFIID